LLIFNRKIMCNIHIYIEKFITNLVVNVFLMKQSRLKLNLYNFSLIAMWCCPL